MKEHLLGFYATRLYLPFSSLSRSWRRLSRRMRGKLDPFLQNVRMKEAAWKAFTKNTLPLIWEPGSQNGNVRISELAILSALASECRPGSNIFEIGTFDGRTTLNLAMSAPRSCQIHTLDLPPDQSTQYELYQGERHMVEKVSPGARYKKYRERHPEAIARIHQWLGDSAVFDYSAYRNSCSLVFVDGSHTYDYAMADTRTAFNLVEPGGMIVWHDYGIWKGVTDALEEIEKAENLSLRNIRGTSLVVWRNV